MFNLGNTCLNSTLNFCFWIPVYLMVLLVANSSSPAAQKAWCWWPGGRAGSSWGTRRRRTSWSPRGSSLSPGWTGSSSARCLRCSPWNWRSRRNPPWFRERWREADTGDGSRAKRGEYVGRKVEMKHICCAVWWKHLASPSRLKIL